MLFLALLPILGESLIVPHCDSTTYWKIINKSDTLCDIYRQHKPLYVIDDFAAKILPNKREDYIRGGWICRKDVYTTKCEFNWFQSNTIDYSISHETPSLEECKLYLDQIQKLAPPDPSQPLYPDPHCSAFASEPTFAYSNHLYVNYVEVYYDPGRDSLVDDLFIGRECRNVQCPTRIPHSIWVAKDQQIKCNFSEEIRVSFVKDNDNDIYLAHPRIHLIPLSQLCRTVRCGIEGYETTSGLFMKFPRYRNFFETTKPCASHQAPKTLSAITQVEHQIQYLQSELSHLKCLEVMRKSKIERPMLPEDLTILHPHRLGHFPVYRVDYMGNLEQSFCDYIQVTRYKSSHPDYLGTDIYGNPILWDHWVYANNKSNPPCEAIGPNGIVRTKNCVLLIPKSLGGDILEEELDEKLSDFSVKQVKLQQDTPSDDPPDYDLKKKFFDVDYVGLGNKISSLFDFGRLETYMWLSMGILIIGGLAYLTLKYQCFKGCCKIFCLPCKSCIKKKKNSRTIQQTFTPTQSIPLTGPALPLVPYTTQPAWTPRRKPKTSGSKQTELATLFH